MIVGELWEDAYPSIEILPFQHKKAPLLMMARLDRISRLASGNKIYKLLGHLKKANLGNKSQLLTFGGADSNHIHALALTASALNIPSIGIIRGEAQSVENHTLKEAVQAGMTLHFVDRQTYRLRYDPEYLQKLQQQFPSALIVPEGGGGEAGVLGCIDIVKQINHVCKHKPTIFCTAMGTGTTLAGVIMGLAEGQSAIGYKIPKDDSLEQRVREALATSLYANRDYSIVAADYGGFAKFDETLLDFILEWLEATGVLLDPIYTSKMCQRIVQQIEAGEFDASQSLMLIHSGGLQGWYGMQSKVVKIAGQAIWLKIEQALNKPYS